jgi:UDP-N-acetylmuramate--alanine ligase
MGIAGAGMSGLARIMLARGLAVSGCEAKGSATATALQVEGAQVFIGHSLAHLDEADTLVYSTAINPEHFELTGARELGLRVLRRATALAATITGNRTIAIAGTHGKTTTTSLLTVAAIASRLDPSYAIGGNLTGSGLNAGAGGGGDFIVEADESDGSFLLLRPDIAVITNVEADHLENHGTLEGVFHAFEQFVDRISPDGLLLACADDPGSRRIADYARRNSLRVRTYGAAPDNDIVVSDIVENADSVQLTATVAGAAHPLRVNGLIGSHIALNAAAAFGVALEMGATADEISHTWKEFQGVGRRFEFKGEAAGVRVYDDYAHHPTEVDAQLRAAREVISPGGRLIAVFQPGTYSRTQTFATEFAQALSRADIAVVMDIFPAREVSIPGVTGALIAERIDQASTQVMYEPDWAAMAPRLAALLRPGDLVLTMGIGDVHLTAVDILSEAASCAEKPL